MSKRSVFQVVLVERGKEGTRDREATPDRLLTAEPVLVLAKDTQDAALQAVLGFGKADFDKSQLEVLARPF